MIYSIIFFTLYFLVQKTWFKKTIQMSFIETLTFFVFYLLVLGISVAFSVSESASYVIFIILLVFFFPIFRNKTVKKISEKFRIN